MEAGPDKTVWLTAANPVATVHIEGMIQSSAELESSILPRWSVRTTEPWGLDTLSLTNEPVGGAKGHVDAVFDRPGIYTMLLEAVTAYGKVVASDTMTVTVEPYGGTLPIVDAGPAPTSCIDDGWYQLLGKVTDDGRPNGNLDIQWTMVKAPANCWVQFDNPKSEETKVHFHCEGTYISDPEQPFVLMLSATDGTLNGAGGFIYESDTIEICVDEIEAELPQGPRVYAGADQILTSGQTNTAAELIYPPGGTPEYSWTQVGGPVGCAQITSPESLNTPISFIRKGDYTFRLTATQGNMSGYDEVRIQVQFPYKVSAGEYESIRLPKPLLLDTVNAADVGTDKDVWIQNESNSTKYDDDIDTELPNLPSGIEVTWSMVKGPGRASFNPPAESDQTQSHALNPTVQFSKAGKYTLRLSAGTSSGQILAADEVKITALPGKLISAGTDHSLAVYEDTIVRACGYDNNEQLGNGNGTKNQSVFDRVLRGQQTGTHSYLKNIFEIATGDYLSFALDNAGYVWSWGTSPIGHALGRDYFDINGDPSPGKVRKYISETESEELNQIFAISTSMRNVQSVNETISYGLALDINGQVWAWGKGPLGRPTSIPIESYVGCCHESRYALRVFHGEQETQDYLQNIIAIDGGWAHVLALSVDGFVLSWGCGINELGSPDSGGQAPTPVYVHRGMQPGNGQYIGSIIAVSAGNSFSVALEKQDHPDYMGRVYTWGTNENGQLGINSNSSSDVPVIVQYWGDDNQPHELTGIKAISAGRDFCLALDNDHHVWAWGSNAFGQLGIGDNTQSETHDNTKKLFAVRVVGPDLNGDGQPDGYFGDHCEGGILQISAGYSHCMAVDAEGTIWAWGGGEGSGPNATGFNKLGIGLIQQNILYPVRVTPEPLTVVNQDTGEVFSSITAAIDAANDVPEVDHDTIVAYPGEYYEHVNFGGKNLTLTSLDPDDPEIVASTIINGGGGTDSVVTIDFNEDTQHYSSGTIKGFTICGGEYGISTGSNGSTEIKIEKNKIVSNEVGIGSIGAESPDTITTSVTNNEVAFNKVGIGCSSNLKRIIEGNRIENNAGMGIVCESCDDTTIIRNNWISGNGTEECSYSNMTGQGGMILFESAVYLLNNTIVNNGNPNDQTGFGVESRETNLTPPDIRSCIIQNNAGKDLEGAPAFFSCVPEGTPGIGNIFDDPKLNIQEHALKPDSPCIDRGSPDLFAGWKLDENEGSVANDWVNDPEKINPEYQYDGTLVNTPIWDPLGYYDLGLKGLIFDDSSDCVQILPGGIDLPNDLMISTEAISRTNDIISIFKGTGSGYQIKFGNYGSSVQFYKNENDFAEWTASWSGGSDRFFGIGKRDDEDIELYINNAVITCSNYSVVNPECSINQFGSGLGSNSDKELVLHNIRLYSGLNPNNQSQRDIHDQSRYIHDKIDIGAYEVPSRLVTAGKDKTLVLSGEGNTVRLSDASVTYHAFNIPLQEGRTFKWSCTSGQESGFEFDPPLIENGSPVATESGELNPKLTFTSIGTYTFELEAREGSNPVGYDKIKIMVLPGVKVQLKDGTNLIDGPIYQSLSSNDSGPTITLQGLSCYYDNGNQIV
ncbi:MAG: hypothetical protein GX455_04825, partial [Phycisphaerae bacterium]|nr:hypothetical protein [Phycisphaerae bacterium]